MGATLKGFPSSLFSIGSLSTMAMLQGPGFLVTFLYYFSCTIVIVVLVTSQGLGVSLDAALPYQLGSLLGLIAGVIGATVNRSVTLSTSFNNKQLFLHSLNEILSEMGFEESTPREDYLIYQKSSFRTLFSGKILVHLNQNSVTIIGRSSNITQLSQKLENGSSS